MSDGEILTAAPKDPVIEAESADAAHAADERRRMRRCLGGAPKQVSNWISTTTWGTARWQRVLVAIVAGFIFWPQSSAEASIGLDPSWQAGLSMARVQHIAWGHELVFTYGPLGFLRTSAFYDFDQALLAAACQVVIIAALLLGIAAVLRLRLSPMAALIVATVTTGVLTFMSVGRGLSFMPNSTLEMMYPELAVFAAFAWASVPLLQQKPDPSKVFTTCVALGAVAGFELLMKFNCGFAVLAIALAASLLVDWKAAGRHAATIVAFGASALICWVLLAGQRPADLPSWLQSSLAIASGYVDGMSASPLPRWGLPVVILSVGWIVALCMMVFRRGPRIPRRYLALVGLATLIAGKAAFGRFEPWHVAILLSLMVVTLVITPWPRSRRPAVGFAVVAVLIIFVLDSGGAPFLIDRALFTLTAPVRAVDRITTFASPGRFRERMHAAKARQRALYAVPDRFIATIGAGTVHIDPQEISVAWAYDLAWRPAMVFQTYQALTPMLDERNGDSLARGPQFVLSRLSSTSPAVGLDGRLGVQESPRYSRSLLCNYKLDGLEDRWALFVRTAPRCGSLTKLSEVSVKQNEVIQVPSPGAPDNAVLMGVDLNGDLNDGFFHGKLAPLSTFTLVVDGTRYRLIDTNAVEPFLISTPASVAGTNLQIHAQTISVGRSVDVNQMPFTARLRFYEMHVAT
ncbi:hypothetical protein ACX9NE_14890 [Mycobacterium sp. ML4]